MPLWSTPRTSNYQFESIRPASSIKHKKRKDHWYDVPGNLLSDIADAGEGFALGAARGIGHLANDIASPITGNERVSHKAFAGLIKGTIEDYKHTYGPLFSGNAGETLRRIKEHPLGPILDILSVASLGAASVGKAGRIAAVGSEGGRFTPAIRASSNPSIREFGARRAGLSKAATARDGILDLRSMADLVPKVPDSMGNLGRDSSLFHEGEFSPTAFAEKYMPDQFKPEENILPSMEDITKRIQDLSARPGISGKTGGTNVFGETYLPRERTVAPKGATSGGYTRQVSENSYKRLKENIVDRVASEYPSLPIIGASGKGVRQAYRLADEQSIHKAQVTAARLNRDKEFFKKEHPILYRAFPIFFPSSTLESRRTARAFQSHVARSDAASLEGRASEYKDRLGEVDPMHVASLQNEDAFLQSPEFRAVEAALDLDKSRAREVGDAIAEIEAVDPARADSIRKATDPKVLERYRSFLRDGVSEWYQQVAPNIDYARTRGTTEAHASRTSESSARAQIKRGRAEEAQFRELASGLSPSRQSPADIASSIVKDSQRYGIDLEELRPANSPYEIPVLSHSIVGDSGAKRNGRGRGRSQPSPSSPEFKKNSYISNEFALNQFNGMDGIIRTVENAAAARNSVSRFRAMIGQSYKGERAPASRGWERLKDVDRTRFADGIRNIYNYLENDFTMLSGGNRIDMVDNLAETLKKYADDLESNGTIWVPTGAVKKMFPEIIRNENLAGKLYSNVTRMWRDWTLGLRPQWMINNMVGNLTLLAMEHGLWTSLRSLYVAYKDSDLKEVIDREAPSVIESSLYREATAGDAFRNSRHAIDAIEDEDFKRFLKEQDPNDSIGATKAKLSFIKNSRLGKLASGQAGMSFNARWIDDPARRAALFANMAPHIDKMKRAMEKQGAKISNADAMAELLKDPSMKDFAIQKTLKDMIDYSDLTPFERQWVRGVFPFYAWLRGMTRRTGQMFGDNPERLALLNQIAERANENPDYGEEYPEWMRRFIRLKDDSWLAGKIRGEDREGGSAALDFGAMNIFQTPADIATLVNAAVYGDTSDFTATGSIANYSNPLLKSMIETITGKNLYTGGDLPHTFTDPEKSNPAVLMERLAVSFPIIRDIQKSRQLVDPDYIASVEDGYEIPGAGRSITNMFLTPVANKLVNDEAAIESESKRKERRAQQLRQAAERKKKLKKRE